MSSASPTPIKRQRATKACDFCHKRGRKCRPATANSNDCTTCAEFGVPCTWSRIAQRRGAKPQPGKGLARWSLSESKHGPRNVLSTFVDSYFHEVYPIVNVLLEKPYQERWRTEQIPNSQASYALLMSICALSAYRFNNVPVSSRPPFSFDIDPDLYLNEAMAAISIDTPMSRSIEVEMVQAICIMCVTALERRKSDLLHKLSGLYHTVVAEHGLHDERQWPKDISDVEMEERRRLYWYMYRFEVHTSLIMGHVVRCPEIQSHVTYPSIPDDDYTESAELEWLTGWNFVTDLYRGMEHLLSKFRSQKAPQHQDRRCLITSSFLDNRLAMSILQQCDKAKDNLPEIFRQNISLTRDTRRNRCGFQTANIICTQALVRMLAYTCNDVTLSKACQTADSFIEEISDISTDFLKAMSAAMLQELSGVGKILSSFIGRDLRRQEYDELRKVMLSMADLLEGLDDALETAAEAGKDLRDRVDSIDQHVRKMQNEELSQRIQLQHDAQQQQHPQTQHYTQQQQHLQQQAYQPPPYMQQTHEMAIMPEHGFDAMQTIPVSMFQNLPWPNHEFYNNTYAGPQMYV